MTLHAYPERRWYHRTHTLARVRIGRVELAWEFKLPDCWLGVYWHRLPGRMDVWLCVIPCLPVHAAWSIWHSRPSPAAHAEGGA